MSQLIRNGTYRIVVKVHAYIFRASHPYRSIKQFLTYLKRPLKKDP